MGRLPARSLANFIAEEIRKRPSILHRSLNGMFGYIKERADTYYEKQLGPIARMSFHRSSIASTSGAKAFACGLPWIWAYFR
jgi:hypothetical protein